MLVVFFFLLSLHCWLATRTPKSPALLAACVVGVVIFHGISLLAKEIAITLYPPLLLLFLLLRGADRRRLDWILAAIIAVMIGAYLLLHRALSESAPPSFFLSFIFTGMTKLFGFYILKFIAPLELYPVYEPMIFDSMVCFVIGAIGVLGCFAVLGWGLWTRTRVALLAAAGAVLAGGSAVLPLVGGQLYPADRYFYQSHLGVGLMLGAVLAHLGPRFQASSLWREKGPRLATALVFLLALLTARQSTFWLREDLLWGHTSELDPTNLYANIGLGDHFERRGDLELAARHFATAAFSERRIRQRPSFDAALSLNRVAFLLGDYDTAERAASFALEDSRLRTDATFRLALLANERGDAERALELLTSLGEDPTIKRGLYWNLARLGAVVGVESSRVRAWYAGAKSLGLEPQAEWEAEHLP